MATVTDIWGLFRERDPEMGKVLDQQEKLAYGDGKLSQKMKLLIGVALASALGSELGVRNHATRAKKAGATEEEIFETIGVAYRIGGTRALATALRGLEGVVKRK